MNEGGELVLWVLGIYGTVLAVAISGAFRSVPDRKLREIAESLGFTLDGDVLRGTWNGVPVTIQRKGRSALISAPAPPDVRIGRMNAAWGQHGERFRTGDASIDQQWVFFGDHDRLTAAFDGAARVHLRELFMAGIQHKAEIADGKVSRQLMGAELQPGTISILLNTVTELSRALHAAPDAPRLSGIARSDLYAGVRRNALAVLARLHPGEPTEAVARDLLDDRDQGVRIEAARLAGELGALQLAGSDVLDAAADADPEGLPARLAVLPEPVLLHALRHAGRLGRRAVAEALARGGTLGAVEALLEAGFVPQARAIQARLGRVDAGALSLAAAEGGQVSLVPEAGAVSVVEEVGTRVLRPRSTTS